MTVFTLTQHPEMCASCNGWIGPTLGLNITHTNLNSETRDLDKITLISAGRVSPRPVLN